MFVDITQQCFAFLSLVSFPANNLNFHWMWRWWEQIQPIFLNLFSYILKVRSLALKWNRMNKPLSHVFRIVYQNIEVLKTNILFSRFNWWDCFHFRFSNVKNSEKGNKCRTKCWNTKIKMWGETYIFHSSPSFSNSYLWILFSWLWALHLCEIKFII